MKRFTLVLLGLSMAFWAACESPNEAEKKIDRWINISGATLASATVQSIAATKSSDVIFVGTFDGIYKSTNGGKSWSEQNEGLENRDVTALALDPTDPQIVYCGTWGKGVYRSDDGGATWEWAWKVNQDPRVNEIVITIQDGARKIWVATENGVYASENEGKSWRHVFSSGRVLTLAVHPKNPSTLFIGVMYKGNFRTLDGGETWQPVNEGIYKTDEGTAAANSFAFHPTDPDVIYMSTGWVDLYRSQDGGLTWQQFAKPLEFLDVVSIAIDERNPGTLWAATEQNGVYRSRDGGETWAEFNSGLATREMKKVCAVNANGTVAYACTIGKGVYKYVDE